MPGAYVLRLTASDGELSAADETAVFYASATALSDLVVKAVDASTIVVDPLSLALSGSAGVELANPGTGPAAGPFVVTVFEDRDANGAYDPGGDAVLGEQTVAGLDASATLALPVAVTGSVTFAGNLVYAFVDSALAVAELDETGGATYHFYLDGTAAPGLSGDGIPDPLPPEARAIHVGTLGLVLEPMATTLEALALGAADDVLVMLDPNCRPSATPDATALRARVQRLAARADVIKVSREDLELLFPGVAAGRAMSELLALGPSAILVTDGGRDVQVVAAAGAFTLPVPMVTIVDTVGAGDAFGGAFLQWWIGRGLGRADLADRVALQPAVEFAIRVASETCRRAGAEPPTAAEMVALA